MRGVSIMLIIYCHMVILPSYPLLGNILVTMAWMGVPLFFMCSGAMLLSRCNCAPKAHLKRLLQMYALLVVWKAIILMSSASTVTLSTLPKSKWITYLFCFDSIPGAVTGHLWFMESFMTVMLIYPIILPFFQRAVRSENRALHIAFLLGLLYIPAFLIHDLRLIAEVWDLSLLDRLTELLEAVTRLFPLRTASNFLFFFVLGGYIFHRAKEAPAPVVRIPYAIALFSTGLVAMLLIQLHQSGHLIWVHHYIENGYAFTATILMSVGFFLWITATKQLPDSPIGFFGRYSQGIFYSHCIVLTAIVPTLLAISADLSALPWNLIKTAVCLSVCSIFILIVRHIPILKKLV